RELKAIHWAPMDRHGATACRLPNLASSEEPPLKRARPVSGSLRAVLFDFDATLTVREERGRGGFQRCEEADVAWLRRCGFGGSERLAQLRQGLQSLHSLSVENHIVSYADRDVIERALTLVELRELFSEVYGVQDLGEYQSKAEFIHSLMQKKGFVYSDVLLVDDQQKNIDAAAGFCMTLKTRERGMTSEDMDQVLQARPLSVMS
ncbi:unnamed protein product, partial [Effrenium voratum]